MERIDKVQNLIPEKPEFVHSNQEKGEAIESLKNCKPSCCKERCCCTCYRKKCLYK